MALGEPDVGDWEQLLTFAERLLGDKLPAYVTWPLGLLILAALILVICAIAAQAIIKIKEAWQNHLRPKTYSPEQRQKAEGRRQFAQHLQLEIVAKNQKENWRDQQFAELEAEVEAEGRSRRFWLLTRANGIRREKSLTLALRHSKERLILVEGDPGTGKSVALRHVAHELAARASKSRSLISKLPVYVNLKEIKRSTGQAINRELIRNFVLTSLNRVNDRFVDEFVEQEFDAGMKSGGWVFLFDSFDEIPDVLSSTESDATIEQYSAAISDFLSGINNCRGVVASRHYRGPQKAGWRTFRILELQSGRQFDLIKRSVIGNPALAPKIRENLAIASDDVRVLARNPMLLGLLCEHVKLGHEFPATAHEVLSKYIDYRFKRDEPRVSARFNISADDLRTVAENCAFAMTADAEIGLSPTIAELKRALAHQNAALDSSKLGDALNALIYMKLGRSAQAEAGGDEAEFTFSHRRFQEHFATCVVLRDIQSITQAQLLTDARWRETAVTMLQTGDSASVQALLSCARGFLKLTPAQQSMTAIGNKRQLQAFPWAPVQLHILRILEAGILGGVERIPAGMRAEIGTLLTLASATDNLLDQKLALEVAGTAPHDVLIELMRDALATGSVWLSDIVYQQASRLAAPVPAIYRSVRISVLRLSRSGALRTEYVATKAYLSRLPSPANLLAALRLADRAPLIDLTLLPAVVFVAALSIDGMRFDIAATACAMFWVSGLLMRRTEIESPFGMFGLGMRIVACMLAYFSLPYAKVGSAQADKDNTFPRLWELMQESDHSLIREVLTPPKFSLPDSLDYYQIAFVIAFSFSAMWYIAAELNIRRGRHLSPLLWPLFPPLLLWDFLMIAMRRPERLRQVAMMLVGVVSFPLFVFVLIPMFPLAAFILFALVILVTIAATISLTDAFIRIGRGQIFVRRWQQGYASAVDAKAFAELLPLVQVPWANVTALRWLADQPLHGQYSAWVSVLEEAIEASTAAMYPPAQHQGFWLLLRERFPTARALRILFRSGYIEQHDRLYRLLERVTATERTL